MPKDSKIPEQAGTIFEDTSMLNGMPLPTKLSRPMMTPKIYKYPVKKLEWFEVETGKNLHAKKIESITVDPIEAKYSILLSSEYHGYPLPLRNVLDIKTISQNTAELEFWGTKTPGVTDLHGTRMG